MDDVVVAATDLARDVSGGPERDPTLVWLHKAEQAQERMRNMRRDYEEECRWRKECIRMAVAMGATPQQVAARLGISRPNVANLAR